MKELYSNSNDCYELAKILYRSLGNKIEFYGSFLANPLPNGKYYTNGHSDPVKFYYKYCKDGFLRVQIGNYYRSDNTLGQKLAALSDFYEVLYKEFGNPLVFYTTLDDDEGLLSMHWSFIDKENELKKFKEGTYFDDAKIDQLIVFNEAKAMIGNHLLDDRTKDIISRKLGLPFELIELVDKDIENYYLHKMGVNLNNNDAKKLTK